MLIHNIGQFKNYIQATAGFTFAQVEQHLLKAQLGDLTRIFGAAFIAAMDARWNNGVPSPALSTQEATVISLLQTAQANFGYVKALPFLTVQNTSSGAAQAESQTNKPLFKWQKIEIQEESLENAWEAVESAIVYLIANRDLSEFATWKNSPAEADKLAFTINTAQDFNTYFAIANSRRTYEAVKSSLRDAEQIQLKQTLGLNLFNELKTQIAAQNVSANNQILLNIAKPAMANLCMASAIYKGDFRFDENGARLVSTTSTGGSDTSKVKAPADAATKAANAAHSQKLGQSYLGELSQYLEANATTYPLYTPSTNIEFDNSTGACFLI
jgi:hypothetical protein